MWMIELAINTMIADNKIGSQSAASETMRTSSLLQLWIKSRQTAFGPRGYSSPLPWSSPWGGGGGGVKGDRKSRQSKIAAMRRWRIAKRSVRFGSEACGVVGSFFGRTFAWGMRPGVV